MYQLAILYLAGILAGFGLANLPTSAIITPGIAEFFAIIGGIAVIVFSVAILYLGLKAILRK
ncbi:hypothetical protein [Cytobacillus purgationiresistens]|uniref:Amino acid transporter n=1 Tax=Cytobacillus purgationiresistens TaxID=863449 RepID=A0ABU0AH21_9BACI|nr:hypothetical protein [Cytobacillus purgationiresistens]MDQ0269718.1 amino acid transporter [Cytobacillus purgationiresistens]